MTNQRMPRGSRTPLIRNIFDDSFDDSIADEAATNSLMRSHAQTMSVQEQRSELADILRRLKRIEQAVRVSQLRADARDMDAIGEGTSLSDIRRRIQRVKALTSPNVTRRSRNRTRRMNIAQNVTGRSSARTRRLRSRTSE